MMTDFILDFETSLAAEALALESGLSSLSVLELPSGGQAVVLHFG